MRTSKILRSFFQAATMLCCLNFAHAADLPTEPILRFDLGGHTASINCIASDDARRYLVTASDDKTARVWSLADGRLLSTLRIPIGSGSEGKLSAVALSPDGQTVAVGGMTQMGNAFLFDRASGRLLRRLTGLPHVTLHLAFSPDGRLLAATGGVGGLRLFSVADGSLLAQDTDYGSASYSMHFNPAVSGSAAQLVTTSYDGFLRLYRFDGQRLSLIAKRTAPGGTQPVAARFSPDGKRIAVGFVDTSAVNVLNAATLTLLVVPDTAGVDGGLYNVAWSQDGQTLFAAGSAQKEFEGDMQVYLRRWSAGGLGAPLDEPVAKSTITDLLALPGGRLAFGSGEPAWGVVDQRGQRTLFHAPLVADFRNNLEGFTLSADGAQVRFGYEVFGESPSVFDSLSRAFLAADSAGLLQPKLTATGLNVTDWEDTTAPKLNGTPLKLEQNEMSRSLALLPDGSGFALGTDWSLRLFDRNGTQRWQQDVPGIVWGVNVSQDGRWIVVAYGDGTIRWHRASDGVEQLAFFPHADKKRWVLWTPSGYYDASPGAEELIGWHINHFLNDNKVEVEAAIKDSPSFRAGFKHGDVLKELNGVPVPNMAWFVDSVSKTPPNGKLQIKILRNAKLQTIEVTPSRDNAANAPRIGLQIYNDRTVLESDFFPASRFRERFYRPDVLTKILSTQDEAKAVRLANEESGRRTQTVTSIAQVLPPVVDIVSPTSESAIQSGKITVRYKVRTAADAPVTAMRVRVNGLLQSDTRALKLVKSNDDVQEIEVVVPAQNTEIQLFAENKFSTSTPAILRLKWAGKVTSVQAKPKLYVLAVGISKYQNPSYNLGLASKDAQDFVASLQKQKGKLYSDVVVKLLTDDKATKDDVLEGLSWLEKNVTASDVGIMFVAGHGMNDKLGGYYFMPHNADPDKLKSTGVSQSDIKNTFASLPGHTVFFIDTCYSGGVMGNVRTSGFVNDLASAENGAVVFTASSAGQLSQENASWGNGAFTKSVVEGLNGKADAFNSGVVTVKGLDFYVDGRVKSLTNGQQTPVSISPGGLSDFPITEVGR